MTGAVCHCVAALVVTASSLGCGSSLKSAHRGEAMTPVKAFLVGVTEAVPQRPFKVISVSVQPVDIDGPAPTSLDEATLDEMKAYAGARGAKMLWVERAMNRWQRKFYGWGLVWVDDAAQATQAKACAHTGFDAAIKAARDAATACLAKLKKSRPGLQGSVEILFDVDAWGGIRQAAPAPSSSRDTQVHSCAMLAVYRRSYGTPDGLWCRATLSAAIP